MRLDKFRVQNYKKIRDSGWVNCCDLTVFVGKNEAGKSCLLRGLSKLNPSNGETYDGLKEFPRKRYSDEYSQQDWPVASAQFALSDDDRKALQGLGEVFSGVTHTDVTRYYSGKLTVGFAPKLPTNSVSHDEWAKEIDECLAAVEELTAPDGKGEALTPIKSAAIAVFNQAKANLPNAGQVANAHIDPVVSGLASHLNESWLKQIFEPVQNRLKGLQKRASTSAIAQRGRDWVVKTLPRFIYFDRFDVIDSAIHIPTFVGQIGTSAPRVRTTHCLFRHVGLDVQKIGTLGVHQPGQGNNDAMRRQVDERAILASSASNAMTAKFSDWWEQRKHRFRYQMDGEYFRIWVSDDLDPSEIELDQRSAGMQYFFSFFTVFLVEAEDGHENSILLLDEPGLHLHGTAQEKIVDFLGKLSAGNQTIYTTHSPFMVDVDHLERARAVYEDQDGSTRVSEDIWPRDKDSLFPLQAALGYQLAQSLFVGKKQLIVEGLTDLWLLKAVSIALRALGKTALREEIVIVPCAGVTKLLPLASMLTGHDVDVAALLDGDEPGRREGKKLVDKLLAGEDRKCLFIGDFLGRPKGGEVEDIFPEADYLSAVATAFPDLNLSFTADENKIDGIIDRIEGFCKRTGYASFNKWMPASVLRDRILADHKALSASSIGVFESIFEKVNALFSS